MLTQRELQSLAIFPLPSMVLFPGTEIALHIFEQRYREMMTDCLREERLVMALAQLKPGFAANYRGRPPLFEVAGLGRIISHEAQRDGTFDIKVEGIARVRLQELPAEQSYRRAVATVLHDSSPHGGLASSDLLSLLALARQLVEHVQSANPSAHVALGTSLDDEPGRMLDKLADQFIADPMVRQRLLETLRTADRLHLLEGCLAELHLAAIATTGNGRGSRTLH